MTNIFLSGGGIPQQSTGSGIEGWIDKLLPVAVLGVMAYIAYRLLVDNGGGAGSNTAGNGGSQQYLQGGGGVLTPSSGVVTGSGNLKGAIIEQPTAFTQNLVRTYTGAPSREPENIMSGASWTRFAVALPQAQIPAWQPPGLIPMQSGGQNNNLIGQIAEYNPATGNAWGGNTSTMQFLYTSMAPEAVAWRARYG